MILGAVEATHVKIQRMISAGNNRMHPIAMTTVAAVFSLLPLAMGLDAGSEMLQPLAIAIKSGLVVQITLVLIVLPGFYILLTEIFNLDLFQRSSMKPTFYSFSVSCLQGADKPDILRNRKTCC